MQSSNDKKLNILIFYDDYACHTSTVTEHLGSFKKYSKHNVFFAIGTRGAFCSNDINFADVVIIHYSVRLSLPSYISYNVAKEINNFNGLKILFLQDEYENTHQARYWIKKLGVNVVFTCIPDKYIFDVYPKDIFHNVAFVNNLTGYVPDSPDLDIIPSEKRENFIVYRGRKLGYWYGALGQEKYEIGLKMKEVCRKLTIKEDIECDDEKRIYGSAWYDFLLSGRATLSTESGANIFDFDGTLKTSIEHYCQENKDATYQEVAKRFLQDDGRILMNQISPKIFQSILCRTALILYEGSYSGVILPNKHYIPLRKDWKNINKVIDRLKDLQYVNEITENAYNDIIKSGEYSYQSFIRKVENVISKHRVTAKQVNVVSTPILLLDDNGGSRSLNFNPYIFSHYNEDRNVLSNSITTIKNSLHVNITPYVTVVDATEAIEGYEFKGILQSRKHYYAATVTHSPLPHFIEFSFVQPIILSKIEIQWLDGGNFASDYAFECWDSVRSKYIELLRCTGHSDECPALEVITRHKGTSFRLVVYETVGQPRLLIRKINFFSRHTDMVPVSPHIGGPSSKSITIIDKIKTIFNARGKNADMSRL